MLQRGEFLILCGVPCRLRFDRPSLHTMRTVFFFFTRYCLRVCRPSKCTQFSKKPLVYPRSSIVSLSSSLISFFLDFFYLVCPRLAGQGWAGIFWVSFTHVLIKRPGDAKGTCVRCCEDREKGKDWRNRDGASWQHPRLPF